MQVNVDVTGCSKLSGKRYQWGPRLDRTACKPGRMKTRTTRRDSGHRAGSLGSDVEERNLRVPLSNGTLQAFQLGPSSRRAVQRSIEREDSAITIDAGGCQSFRRRPLRFSRCKPADQGGRLSFSPFCLRQAPAESRSVSDGQDCDGVRPRAKGPPRPPRSCPAVHPQP